MLVGTAADNLASRSHCRCSRPTDRTGITIGEPEHEENCSADPTCAATAWNRTRRVDPRSHRCDCWTASPAAEATTPPGSKHRDAPAVKAARKAKTAIERGGPICIQRVHGPPLADFAMRGKGNSAFLLWGCPQVEALVGTFLGPSRWCRALWTRVPSMAVCGSARPWRLDGCL